MTKVLSRLDMQAARLDALEKIVTSITATGHSTEEPGQDGSRLRASIQNATKALQASKILSDDNAAKLEAWARLEEEGSEERARLLAQAATMNKDAQGNFNMLPGLKTQLNQALEKGDTQAIDRALMIWKHQGDFITADMDGYARVWIIDALAKLSPEKIKTVATNRAQFFTADMNARDRAMIIMELAQKTHQEIAERAAEIRARR